MTTIDIHMPSNTHPFQHRMLKVLRLTPKKRRDEVHTMPYTPL